MAVNTPSFGVGRIEGIINVTGETRTTTKNFLSHEKVAGVRDIIEGEIEEQKWRSEMVKVQHSMSMANNSAAIDGDGANNNRFLKVLKRDNDWKTGGWARSVAVQRRAEEGGAMGATEINVIAKKKMKIKK